MKENKIQEIMEEVEEIYYSVLEALEARQGNAPLIALGLLVYDGFMVRTGGEEAGFMAELRNVLEELMEEEARGG